MKIVIASGKGGTGKTFLATNLSYIFSQKLNKDVTYLDCDVEEPNGHLFLPPERKQEDNVIISSPINIYTDKCDGCGRCSDVCAYNAIAMIKEKALLFPELCHVCGACLIVCPENAIQEGERTIGSLINGKNNGIDIHYGFLKQGEGGMSPSLIKRVKKQSTDGINILDAPPGTSCSAVEAVSESDLCVLVTDLTPFGLHDLKLSVNMCRAIGIEPVVIINRSKFKDPGVRKYCSEVNVDIVGEIDDDRQVAELYSKGYLVAKRLYKYENVFKEIAEKLMSLARDDRPVREKPEEILKFNNELDDTGQSTVKLSGEQVRKARQGEKSEEANELVVISGKGGTGKTSIVASFAAIAKEIVVADCDVDASDLHLVLKPQVIESGLFSGGYLASIDPEKCNGCGECFDNCRFEAILRDGEEETALYMVDELACEGCGVCRLVCEYDAVKLDEALNGEWYISAIKYGYMSHAKLGIAEENSGRLVTLTRQNAAGLCDNNENEEEVYIDGSPGTGCPVIASLTGVNYALVVTEPTVSGLHDLERILELCKFFGIRTGVVVNKWDINPEKTNEIKTRVSKLGLDYLGSLPYDENVIKAQIEGESIIEYEPECEVSNEIRSFFDKVKNKLK